MKYIRSNTFIGVLCYLLAATTSCRTSQIFTSENLPDYYLTYGSFGGFSGNQVTHFILPNGQVFTHESLNNTYTYHKGVSKKEAREVYKMLGQSHFRHTNLKAYGNMNYFISTYKDQKLEHEVIWGEKGPEPPENLRPVTALLDQIIAQLPNETP